jgi:hypothetical protein
MARELRVAASAPECFLGGCYKAVIAPSAEPAVNVVWGFQSVTLAWRFALRPGAIAERAGASGVSLGSAPEVARDSVRP